jgi:hypothetical protein
MTHNSLESKGGALASPETNGNGSAAWDRSFWRFIRYAVLIGGAVLFFARWEARMDRLEAAFTSSTATIRAEEVRKFRLADRRFQRLYSAQRPSWDYERIEDGQ